MKTNTTSRSNKSNKTNKSIKPSKSSKPISRTSHKVAAKVVRPIKRTMVINKSMIKSLTMDEMVSRITDAIQFKFRSDKTNPGLVISKLGNGDFYAAVVRYNAPFGKDKVVEYKARGNDIMTVLYSVAQQITGQHTDITPVDHLSRYIGVSVSN